MLIVMSGLPGAGKSSIARELGRSLGVAVLSVDPVEAALWRAGIAGTEPTGLAAYVVVEAMAADLLALGQRVIVDAVNDAEPARAQWHALAGRQAAELRFIEVVCSDPDVHRERLRTRRRGIEGFPEPDWESVEARRPAFAAWRDPRLTLDSMAPIPDNTRKALAYLMTG